MFVRKCFVNKLCGLKCQEEAVVVAACVSGQGSCSTRNGREKQIMMMKRVKKTEMIVVKMMITMKEKMVVMVMEVMKR